MRFFKRENRVLDLTKRYEKQKARAEEVQQENSSSETNAGGLGFFGAIANSVSQNATGMTSENGSLDSEYLNVSSGVEDKRRKLAKRLMEMTNKIEELSNQIYHLQQRIEVLEKKGGVTGY